MRNRGLGNRGKRQKPTVTMTFVSDVSAPDKAALISRGAARTIVRSRWGRAFAAVASSLLRVGHVLWLEVTGFFFAVFAVIGGAGVSRGGQVAPPAGRRPGLGGLSLFFS